MVPQNKNNPKPMDVKTRARIRPLPSFRIFFFPSLETRLSLFLHLKLNPLSLEDPPPFQLSKHSISLFLYFSNCSLLGRRFLFGWSLLTNVSSIKKGDKTISREIRSNKSTNLYLLKKHVRILWKFHFCSNFYLLGFCFSILSNTDVAYFLIWHLKCLYTGGNLPGDKFQELVCWREEQWWTHGGLF